MLCAEFYSVLYEPRCTKVGFMQIKKNNIVTAIRVKMQRETTVLCLGVNLAAVFSLLFLKDQTDHFPTN